MSNITRQQVINFNTALQAAALRIAQEQGLNLQIAKQTCTYGATNITVRYRLEDTEVKVEQEAAARYKFRTSQGDFVMNGDYKSDQFKDGVVRIVDYNPRRRPKFPLLVRVLSTGKEYKVTERVLKTFEEHDVAL